MPFRQYLPIFALITLFGCYEEPVYPVEPEIEFERINVVTAIPIDDVIERDIVTITVTFKDGDGDLGLDINGQDAGNEEFIVGYDTINGQPRPIYKNNYFIKAYKEQDGAFQLVEFPDNQSFDGSFQRLNTSDKEKAIEGELDYTFEIFFTEGFQSPLLKGDIAKFEIQIDDRKLNLSNTIETPPIIIGENFN